MKKPDIEKIKKETPQGGFSGKRIILKIDRDFFPKDKFEILAEKINEIIDYLNSQKDKKTEEGKCQNCGCWLPPCGGHDGNCECYCHKKIKNK